MANNAILRFDDFSMDETQQIIEAIRSGHVDAFVVEERDGHTVYTLHNADLPYSALVQHMQQGAAMLNAAGDVIYCNSSLAALLGMSTESLVACHFADLVAPEDRAAVDNILEQSQTQSRQAEVRLRTAADKIIPARLSITSLSRDASVTGVLVADLTTEKANSELAARLQQLQDEERRNLARELHDSVGQLLVAISMNLNALRKEAADLAPSLLPTLDDSNVMVDQVSSEIRTISHLLHPPLLGIAGLSSAIRWYVDGFAERSRIAVDLDVASEISSLPNDVEIALFRVVQECLTNVYRHSGSKSCSIRLERQPNRLRLEIQDAGKGMPKDPVGQVSGVGIRGMKERLRHLGGTLEITSSPSGTTIVATVPLADPPDQRH